MDSVQITMNIINNCTDQNNQKSFDHQLTSKSMGNLLLEEINGCDKSNDQADAQSDTISQEQIEEEMGDCASRNNEQLKGGDSEKFQKKENYLEQSKNENENSQMGEFIRNEKIDSKKSSIQQRELQGIITDNNSHVNNIQHENANMNQSSNLIAIITPNNEQSQVTFKTEIYPNTLNELQSKYTSILDFDTISKELIEFIGNEIIRLTTVWQGKNINTLNKQFQNSVMNYFLECYVSELLVAEFQVEFKRDVFKQLTNKMEREEGSQLKKRYITLLNYFLDALQEKGKISGYIELLMTIIHESLQAENNTIDYQTQYRKKMTALLLLEHCLHADRRAKFTDFYSLWSHVFTFCPLKRKKSKSQDRPRRVHVSHLQDLSNPTQKYSCKIMQKNLLLAQNAPCSAAVKEIPILPALTANPPSSILISTKINGTQKQGKGGKCTDSGKDSLPCSQQSLTLIQTNKKKRSESQISPLMAGGSSSIITQNQLDQIPYEERSKAQSALSGTQMTKPLAVKHEDEYSNSFTPASSIFKSPEIVDGVSMKAIGIASNNFQSNLELQQQSLNSLTSLQNELQKKCSTSDCNPPELRKQMKSEDYRIASNMIQGNPSQLLSQSSGQPQSLAPYLQNTIVINSQQAPQFMNQQLLNANRQMDMSQLFLQNIGFQQPIQQQQQQQQNAQLLLQLNQQQQHLLQQSQQQQQQQSQQNQLQNHGQIFSYPISLNALQQQSQQQQSQQTQQQQSIQLLQAPIMQLPAHQLLQNQQLLQFHYQQQQQNQFPAQQQQSQQQNQWQQQQQQTQVIHDILSNEIIVLNPQTQQYIRYSPKQELLAGNPQQQGGITFNQIPQNLIDQMQAGMIIQQNSPLDAFSSLHQQKLQQQQQQQKMTQLFQ